VAVAALPGAVSAATATASLSFVKNDTALGGGTSFGFDTGSSLNVGIGTVDFGAEANSGDVDASASFDIDAHYQTVIDLVDAATTRIDLALGNLSFAYDTFVGAAATAGINFGRIQIPIPLAPDIDVNPPRIAVIDEDYTLTTARSGSSLGTRLGDSDNTDVAGVGPSTGFGILLQTQLTLDASKETSFELTEIDGILRATHSSGATRQGAFDIFSTMDSVDLDLSLAGAWDLDLVGVRVRNLFDSSLGLAVSARVGFGAGFNCGDLTRDDDNGFGCIADTGAVATSPQLTLIDPAAFEIDFGTRSADIGGLTVLAPPPPAIPVPASLPLLAAGIGGLALWRRRAG
jgi:hypothetical protein